MQNRAWAIILNPHAKGGRAAKIAQKLFEQLNVLKITFAIFETKGPGGGEDCARQCIDAGYRQILVAGGDGSVYDVLNGMLSHPAYTTDSYKLAVFPIGTGNDFARITKAPADPLRFAELLGNMNFRRFDVGQIIREEKPVRYFINVAGLGFDAQVAAYANELKKKGYSGLTTYVFALISTLFRYSEADCTIRIDESEPIRKPVFTVLAGNGTHAGKGMCLAPDADPTDGYFHITCVGKISRFKVVRNVHRIFGGTFKHFNEVTMYKARSVKIIPHTKVALQADGELLETGAVEFKVLPAAVELLVR
ncbi:MAG: diacylglycerol/lipid kinase family protein [Bacteroidia bacterium]|jgi:YegS/Rv2252/BmrU family lipid kinase